MKQIIKSFDNESDQLKWIHENRNKIRSQRKSISKNSDSVSFISFAINERGETLKSEEISADATKLRVRVIINTTNLYDSHGDVHINNIWKKSLSESKVFYLVNQHMFNYEGILSDEVKASAKMYAWKDLGYDYEGETQALVFDTVLDLESPYFQDSPANKKIFNLYKAGKIRNHSVQMRYVKDFICMDSEDYPEEKKNWDKYYPMVANKDDVGKYFFAVTEAKIIEGSAVPRGSNSATPTESVQEVKNIEAEAITSKNEPTINVTQTSKQNLFIKI